jgi:hypothetical protein
MSNWLRATAGERIREKRQKAAWSGPPLPLNRETSRQGYRAETIIPARVLATVEGCCAPDDVAADAIYVVGEFSDGILRFYDSAGNLSNIELDQVGDEDTTYLVKYNSLGIPLWAARIGSPTNNADAERPAVVADTDGSVYLAGEMDASGELEFYNAGSNSPAITLTISDTIDAIYIAKYSSDGIIQWATTIATTLETAVRPSITVDRLHNIYVAGYYDGELNIYEAGNTDTPVKKLPGPVGEDIDNFLVKYTSAGQYVWATRIGGTGEEIIPSIICDVSNNIIIAGYYFSNPLEIYNQTDLSNTVLTLPTEGSGDNYLIKFNSNGIMQWATHIGGAGREDEPSIATDSQANIYISAFYDSSGLSFYNQTDQVNAATTIGNDSSDDMYLAKYSPSGVVGGIAVISGTSDEIQPDIAVDKDDNIIVSGSSDSSLLKIYNGGQTLNPLPVTPNKEITFVDGANNNAFLLKFNPSCIIQWGSYVGPTYNQAEPSVTTDTNGNICLTGEYFDINIPTTLHAYDAQGTSTLTLESSNENTNTFIIKYSTTGTPVWGAQALTGNNPQISTPFKV